MIGTALGKLCRHPWVLAGVALLCLSLPLCIAPAAENVLSRGVSFSGIHLAVTGEEGDSVPELLEKVMSNMTDVSRYCRVSAMEHDEALAALEDGDVTAVLALPEGFIGGVMNGSNPDVELIVSSDYPLESLLTLWIGQSASDLLAAVQSGIYGVLEIYQTNPPDGLSYSDAVTQINLRYVNWTVNRQDLYRVRTVEVTDQLPVGQHYALSLLAYLLLAAAPLFVSIFDSGWIRSQRRFRALGHGMGKGYSASLAACVLVMFPMIAAVELAVLKGGVLASLGAALGCSLFCGAFVSLCCLLTSGAGSCGVLSFLCALVFLVLSGGVLPPVLMPATLRNLLECSPITWLRSLMALCTGEYEPRTGMILAMVISTAVMIAAGAALYRRRGMQEERP